MQNLVYPVIGFSYNRLFPTEHFMHAAHRLYFSRKSKATKPFKARGFKVLRCQYCQLAESYCVCSMVKKANTNAGFLLLMYDTEILKPSNTGKLIADIVPDVHAFIWSRTEVEQALLDVINDPKWFPIVIFPEQYAEPSQEVINSLPVDISSKRPLFIMLDGSWREAKKMFRKSPYLQDFPVFSIDPEKDLEEGYLSKYQIRKAQKSEQLATAEVAAHVLALTGEPKSAAILSAWFEHYTYQYQKSVKQRNMGNADAKAHYLQLINS